MDDVTVIVESRQAVDVLNQHLKEAATEILVLAAESPSAQDIEPSAGLLRSDPNLAAVLHFASGPSLGFWDDFPHRLAALTENPPASAVVLKVSAVKELGFREVSEPVWDLVIRLSETPGRIAVRDVDGGSPLVTSQRPGLTPARPGAAWDWLNKHLRAALPEDLVPQIGSRPDLKALRAGLFQIHDYLDESHDLSQNIEGEGRHRAGDYWHAIMHRREPDYSNSKYWFRRVGSHPISESLANVVAALLSNTSGAAAQKAREKLLTGGGWDPFAFVDFCEECAQTGDPEQTAVAEQVQWLEMQLLLEQTYRDASE